MLFPVSKQQLAEAAKSSSNLCGRMRACYDRNCVAGGENNHDNNDEEDSDNADGYRSDDDNRSVLSDFDLDRAIDEKLQENDEGDTEAEATEDELSEKEKASARHARKASSSKGYQKHRSYENMSQSFLDHSANNGNNGGDNHSEETIRHTSRFSTAPDSVSSRGEVMERGVDREEERKNNENANMTASHSSNYLYCEEDEEEKDSGFDDESASHVSSKSRSNGGLKGPTKCLSPNQSSHSSSSLHLPYPTGSSRRLSSLNRDEDTPNSCSGIDLETGVEMTSFRGASPVPSPPNTSKKYGAKDRQLIRVPTSQSTDKIPFTAASSRPISEQSPSASVTQKRPEDMSAMDLRNEALREESIMQYHLDKKKDYTKFKNVIATTSKVVHAVGSLFAVDWIFLTLLYHLGKSVFIEQRAFLVDKYQLQTAHRLFNPRTRQYLVPLGAEHVYVCEDAFLYDPDLSVLRKYAKSAKLPKLAFFDGFVHEDNAEIIKVL